MNKPAPYDYSLKHSAMLSAVQKVVWTGGRIPAEVMACEGTLQDWTTFAAANLFVQRPRKLHQIRRAAFTHITDGWLAADAENPANTAAMLNWSLTHTDPNVSAAAVAGMHLAFYPHDTKGPRFRSLISKHDRMGAQFLKSAIMHCVANSGPSMQGMLDGLRYGLTNMIEDYDKARLPMPKTPDMPVRPLQLVLKF